MGREVAVKDTKILSYLVKKEEKRRGFAWKKKIERDIAQGAYLGVYSSKGGKKRQRERAEELKKLKKSKAEREIQKAQHEEERNLLARERARAEFKDWEEKEKEFGFHQIKVKSEIRLREGRAKPIDLLMKHGMDQMNEEQYMNMFKDLSIKNMEELIEEMKLISEFDRETPARIQYWESLLVICERELEQLELKNNDAIFEHRRLHSSIEAEVTEFLLGKSYNELEAIQSQIESKMRSGKAEVVEYWEELIRLLPVAKARAFLKDVCSTIPSNPNPNPNLLEETELEKVDEQLGSNDEIDLNLHDEYQLRKPKYSNIVHSAYEWNKYNRTHYDNENKPPKIVQGYKFNIFYPDLVDKRQTPKYVFQKDGDETSTCIIRFTAGPPYEDIAFKIVNKEIEVSRKKGFKSTFDGGVLRLHFNFKRYSYRR